MSASRTRAKRSSALAGIPKDVVKLAPPEWTDARKGQWCRAYLKGAASPHASPDRSLPRDLHAAYRAGQRDASARTADVAQVAALAEGRRRSQERRDDAMDAADERRGALRSRLDSLMGRFGMDVDHRVADIAATSLGLGGFLGGIGRRGR